MAKEDIKARVIRVVMNLLGEQNRNQIQTTQPLMDMGLDSLAATQLVRELTSSFQIPLSPTVLFDFPTIELLVNHICNNLNVNNNIPKKKNVVDDDNDDDYYDGDYDNGYGYVLMMILLLQ
jgi:acyl carrier protein